MAKKIISHTLLTAQLEYYKNNNISLKKKDEVVVTKDVGKDLYGIVDAKDFGIYISLLGVSKPVVIMEDKEIVEKLLVHYDELLNKITRHEIFSQPVVVRDLIFSASAELGICKCSRHIFGVPITNRWFVTQFQRHEDGFWYKTSVDYWTSKEMVDCISYRVKKLTEIKNSII